MLGLFCYVTSTFLGAVMAVVKTISIGHPFYPLNERALKMWLIIIPSTYLLIGDVWFWIAWFDYKSPKCTTLRGTWEAYYQVESSL